SGPVQCPVLHTRDGLPRPYLPHGSSVYPAKGSLRLVRLRTLLRIGAAFLSLLGVAASVALYLTAAAMERNGWYLLDSVEGVRVAERLETALGWTQEVESAGLVGVSLPNREEVVDARRALDNFDRYIANDREQDLVNRVRRNVDVYLATPAGDPKSVRSS